jgi:hypothetical protein
MGRTFQELVDDLFRHESSVQLAAVSALVERQGEEASDRTAFAANWARIVTETHVECFEKVLSEVISHFDVPSTSLGVRTTADLEELLDRFEARAGELRTSLHEARDRCLAGIKGLDFLDEFHARTSQVLDEAKSHSRFIASWSLAGSATAPEPMAAIRTNVDSDVSKRQRNIINSFHTALRAVAERRPPRREAYDPNYFLRLHIENLQDRSDDVLSIYEVNLKQLGVKEVSKSLEVAMRTHIAILRAQVFLGFRLELRRFYDEWRREPPPDEAAKDVVIVRQSFDSRLEALMLRFRQPIRVPPATVPSSVGPLRRPSAPALQPAAETSHGRGRLSKAARWSLGVVFVAFVGVAAYWVNKTQIDSRQDMRARQVEMRDRLLAELLPLLDRCGRAANDLGTHREEKRSRSRLGDSLTASYRINCDYIVNNTAMSLRLGATFDSVGRALFDRWRVTIIESTEQGQGDRAVVGRPNSSRAARAREFVPVLRDSLQSYLIRY